MTLRSTAATDVGRVRDNNEDAYLANDTLGIYAVADGIGGHPAGEVASRIAVDFLSGADESLHKVFGGDWDRKKMAGCFEQIHREILRAMTEETAGMGTTLTTCTAKPAPEGLVALVTHCGDSSAYLVRNGGPVSKLTRDHDLRWRNPRVPAYSAWANTLMNCLGSSQVDFRGVEHAEALLYPHDRVVLLTDGVTRYLTDLNMLRGAVAVDLVDFALRCGGEDNVTAVVVEAIP